MVSSSEDANLRFCLDIYGRRLLDDVKKGIPFHARKRLGRPKASGDGMGGIDREEVGSKGSSSQLALMLSLVAGALLAPRVGFRSPRSRRHLGLRVLAKMWKAGRSYQRFGLSAAPDYLDSVPRHAGGSQTEEVAYVGYLEKLAWRLTVVSRLMWGRRPCLFESVVVAAGLRKMGIPAEVVIAHVTSPVISSDPVHAWVSLNEHVLTEDAFDGLYFEITRFPKEDRAFA